MKSFPLFWALLVLQSLLSLPTTRITLFLALCDIQTPHLMGLKSKRRREERRKKGKRRKEERRRKKKKRKRK